MKKFGIDISMYQKGLNLKKAKEEGVEFVIIKCSQQDFLDPEFKNHVANAIEAKLPFGFYHYLKCTSVDDAKVEAKFCAKSLKENVKVPFDYPVFVDVEDPLLYNLSTSTRTEMIKAFCNILENEGYWCGFYTNYDWYLYKLNGAELAERYSMWFAYWGTQLPSVEGVQMWQFGGSTNYIRSNTIAGVVCDQDYCFTDYPSLIKAKGLNGYSKPVTPAPKPTPKPTPKPEPKPTPKPEPKPTFKVGDKIKLKSNAVVYGTTNRFFDYVYNTVYYIREINGDRAVFAPAMTGGITGAVSTKYIEKV